MNSLTAIKNTIIIITSSCLSYVVLAEAVAHSGEDLTQKLLGDLARAVLVEAAEGVLDDLLGVGALQPLSEQRQEHGEVDGARGLAHHALQVLVGRVLAWWGMADQKSDYGSRDKA